MTTISRSLAAIITLAATIAATAHENTSDPIRISTDRTDLIMHIDPNGRLYQAYLGPKLRHSEDIVRIPADQYAGYNGAVSFRDGEMYPSAATEDFFEPAFAITHNDGNTATYLYYIDSQSTSVDGGTHTRIVLRDKVYPVEVVLNYIAYPKENVIKTWSEISHKEKRPVRLSRYASAMLHFNRPEYYLTSFHGDWADEAHMDTQKLMFGKKIIDTNLGSRAAMFAHSFFNIGFDKEPQENSGDVLMGTLGWTGNFRLTFDVDNAGNLRILPGINPYASVYELKPEEVFVTPEFVFTLSENGTGEGSRNLHDWARRYSLKDGDQPRMTLLNNWENTYFSFDQEKLSGLMEEAEKLGVDMFLLDDGWFANKYPRNSDKAGLGDWEVNRSKLPGGIAALTEAAKKANVKFGIWIEPEMVNPESELFEKHPDWVIMQPNRDTYYYRNQLVLDLSNPAVQEHVFNVVDRILSENPEVAYFKWDCNSPITNAYSPYCKDRQGQMYIDHVRGLYRVLDRIKVKYPDVPMMLCSGGSGRADYEALKYFTEFWTSDNTDPIERLHIQWGYSHIFPAKAMAAHVTSWNKNTSVKFRTDVASMCKLGFDIGLDKMTGDEIEYCRQAVANWKRLQPAIMDGDMYRLISPEGNKHMAVNYVDKNRQSAVVFAYDIQPRIGDKLMPVRPKGLDPDRHYRVTEINLMPGTESKLAENGKTYTGDYLMKIGLNLLSRNHAHSTVVELEAL